MYNDRQPASSSSSSSAGIGFFGALGILFIALKLLGYINWSWWLVLLPIYGSIIFWMLVFVIILAVVGMRK